MALFRVDFSGRGELSERQQKVRRSFLLPIHFELIALQLAQVLSKLTRLSEEFNVLLHLIIANITNRLNRWPCFSPTKFNVHAHSLLLRRPCLRH